MNKETKKVLIETAKDALLEVVELVAQKVAESARGMRTKELRFEGMSLKVTPEGMSAKEFVGSADLNLNSDEIFANSGINIEGEGLDLPKAANDKN